MPVDVRKQQAAGDSLANEVCVQQHGPEIHDG